MTNRDFVIWMKGFVMACNEYTPTPKQWDAIKDQLEHTSDNESMWNCEPNKTLIRAAEKYKKYTLEENKIF
jgi:hypothetical protein